MGIRICFSVQTFSYKFLFKFMRNQLQELTIDQFRFQLNRLEKQEKDLNLEKKEVKVDSLYNIKELPMSISNVTSWISFLMHYLWPVHIVLCYFQSFHNVYHHGPTWITIFFNSIFAADIIGSIINGILLVLIIISIFFWQEHKAEGIVSIFRYIKMKIFPFTRYIIGLCLYLTSFFALNDNVFNLTLFILAVFATLIKTALLNNFTLRKDQFCCKSFEFLFLSRIITIVSLSLGITAVKVVKTQNQLLIFVLIQSILGVTVIVSYFNFGIYTYRHKSPRFLLLFLIVLYSSIALAMLFDVLQALGNGSFNFYIQALLTLIIATYLTHNTLDRRRRLSQSPENKNLKEKIFFLFNKFESSDIDNEDDAQLRGLLNYHFVCGCKNLSCVVNFEQVYDSKKKKTCSIKKIAQSKVSLVKFYAKCLLETAMQEDPQNTETMLDYLQFYYLKLKNIFVVLKLLADLQQKLLSPIQRLRVVRLKRILKEESNSFSEDLYLGKMSIQQVLEAEETFDTLVKGIDLVLQRNQLFWKYIARNEVFLGDILDLTKANFSFVDKLSDKWMNVAKYFDINRRWKLYFLCYTLYIKNEKLKPWMYQDLGNSVQYDTIFKTNNYFIDKTTQKEALYNPIMLFEQNTCFIVSSCDEQKMVVKRVSNYFNRLFEYEPNQIAGSHLDELMPTSVKAFHHKMFVNWAKFGKNKNESFYSVKKVTPITKKGYLVPCFKFYKYYILNNGEIEYIAMLKKNKKQEMIILVNQHFEIQAITHALAQKLRILSNQDYSNFRGFNLLMLIPMLAKYTYYANELTENDDDFNQMDENQNIFRKQGTFIPSASQEKIDVLGLNKQLNLTNIKVTVPCDIQGLKSEIRTRRRQHTNEFEVVRECYSLMRKRKSFLKFKADLCIRQHEFSDFDSQKFYYVEINELQENNRLQKMKMQEQRMQQLSDNSNMKDYDSSAQMDVDIQAFLQVNKKRNRIVLFPSDNIFIKEENNQALTKVNNISIINNTIRVTVIFLVFLLLGMLIVEFMTSSKLKFVNSQFYWMGLHQKYTMLLNSQYNIQHMQPGNGVEESFYIVFYTQQINRSYKQTSFQSLLYDADLNTQEMMQPYFSGTYPYKILSNINSQPQDQIGIFQYLHQSSITLHRETEFNPFGTLETEQYHIFNNYIYSYYNKTQSIKVNIIKKYKKLTQNLATVHMGLALTQGVLILGCLVFVLSRLIKVINGFSQLVSIFIQMDNVDIKKIAKFVNYTIKIFDQLNDKYNKMKNTQQLSIASSSNFRDLEKVSSELGRTQEMMGATVGANLNKKIKKIEVGDQINYIKRKAIFLLLVYLILIGCFLSIFTLYSKANLDKLNQLQSLGFTLISNNSITDAITTGLIERFRKAQIFRADKYTRFFNDFDAIMQNSVYLVLSSADNQLGNLFKTVYYQDFCKIRMDVLNETFDANLKDTCGSTNLAAQECEYLFKTVNDVTIMNRCETIQSSFLNKGVVIFYNYLLLRTMLYFNNGSVFTVNEIVEINDALKIIGVYDIHMMKTWLSYITEFISSRLVTLIMIVAVSIVAIIVLHFVFVEYLFTHYLGQNYEIFRRMHEYLIPEFVINKEKIIKAKLVREGFMKE